MLLSPAFAQATSTAQSLEVRATVATVESPRLKHRTAAIFVENRAGVKFNDKILAFEDQVTAQLASADFQIISREEILKAKKVYATEAEGGQIRFYRNTSESARATAIGTTGAAEAVAKRSTTDIEFEKAAPAADENLNANRNSLGTKADRELSDQSSAVRLAQAMGAEYVLFVNIGSYGTTSNTFNSPEQGLKGVRTVHTLRGTCKIADAYTGGTMAGNPFKATKSVLQVKSNEIQSDDLENELIEDGAQQIVGNLTEKVASLPRPSESEKVTVTIHSFVKDLHGNEISLPDIHLTEGKVAHDERAFPAMLSATIKIDGFAVGVTPANLRMFAGPHKIKLERPGFESFEGTIIAQEGTTLAPTLQMTPAGFERWKEIRRFLNELDTKREYTKAYVSVMEGYAQMLRQTGFLVDMRSNTSIKQDIKQDVKVDAKKLPNQNVYLGRSFPFWLGR